MQEKVHKVVQAATANPYTLGDATAVIPTGLAILEQAPNIAALFTILWFVYRFIREFRRYLRDQNDNSCDE